jgi:hypothetical protein
MGPFWVQTVAAASPAGAQTPYAADWLQSPFQVGWSVEGLGGGVTGTYNIEATLDDVNAVASPTYFAVASGLSANASGTIGPGPVAFIRVNFTVGPAGGNPVFRLIQGMTSR